MSASPTGPCDVVIVGGGMMGASTAWWLTELAPGLRVTVIERDGTYAQAATSLTNSCMRQQFSTELNVRISQFAAEFVTTLRARMGGDERVPELSVREFGYMYLAGDEGFADVLRANAAVQRAAGAATVLMTPEEIAAAYPFYALDGIVLGSINRRGEGYWDGAAVFDALRRSGPRAGGGVPGGRGPPRWSGVAHGWEAVLAERRAARLRAGGRGGGHAQRGPGGERGDRPAGRAAQAPYLGVSRRDGRWTATCR